MTLIVYSNDTLYSDRCVLKKTGHQSFSEAGVKSFISKENDIAIAVSGELPDKKTLQHLFKGINVYIESSTMLSLYQECMPEKVEAIDLSAAMVVRIKKAMVDIFPAMTMVMTTKHTFKINNRKDEFNITIIDDMHPEDEISDGSGVILFQTARRFDCSIPQAYKEVSKIDHLVSPNYDVIYRSQLKRYKMKRAKDASNPNQE